MKGIISRETKEPCVMEPLAHTNTQDTSTAALDTIYIRNTIFSRGEAAQHLHSAAIKY